MNMISEAGLEMKFCRFDEALTVREGHRIEGYASLFGACDQGGDVVQKGAYARSLKGLAGTGRLGLLLLLLIFIPYRRGGVSSPF